MISRLTAQRALMEEAARLIADQPGPRLRARPRQRKDLRPSPPDPAGPRDLRLRPRHRRAPEVHPRRRPPDPRRNPRDARILRPAHSRQAGLHPCRPRLRRPDAGSDHARLALAACHEMVGARHDRARRPSARGRVPRSSAAARLPEIRPRPPPRRVSAARRSRRMRIAFYAPLKPPDHPVTSGDRAMARALIAALKLAGHEVTIASRFRSRDAGDPRAPGAAAR